LLKDRREGEQRKARDLLVAEFHNREKAYVPLSKLKDYLLSETHLVGRSKAKLLRSVGFNEMNAGLLEEGLIAIARAGDINEVVPSPYGVKYLIDGMLKAPTGGFIKMRTIWIIDKGQVRPRFVTAYPLGTTEREGEL
jgi:hypothetical protein